MDVGTTVAGVGSTRSVADVVAVVVVDSLRRSLHRKVLWLCYIPLQSCQIILIWDFDISKQRASILLRTKLA